MKQAIEEGFIIDVVWRFDGLLRTLATNDKRRPDQRLAAWRAVSLSGKRSSGTPLVVGRCSLSRSPSRRRRQRPRRDDSFGI
jgi:hypothetical protein